MQTVIFRLEEMYPRNDALHLSIPDLRRQHKTSPAAVGLWFTARVTCHRGEGTELPHPAAPSHIDVYAASEEAPVLLPLLVV